MTWVFLVEIRTLESAAQVGDKICKALSKIYGKENVTAGYRPDLDDDEHKPVDDDY